MKKVNQKINGLCKAILILTLVLFSQTGFGKIAINEITQVKFKPKDGLSPINITNTVQVGSDNILLPPSLEVVQLPSGKYKLKKIDLLGHIRVGNGGDFIRSTFAKLGLSIANYLDTTVDGQKTLAKTGLTKDVLVESLDINNIVVTDEILFDNTGSVVDAIGIPGLIFLNNQAWIDHFEKNRDVYYLIFHEMLRSSAVNDDNYVISNDLLNFPSAFKLSTSLLPLIPMLEEDSIQNLIRTDKINLGGKGCSLNNGQTYTEINLLNNSLEISMNNNIAKNSAQAATDNSACTMAIPVTVPTGKKLVISLIDFQGQVSSRIPSTTAQAVVRFEAFLAGLQSKINVKNIDLKDDSRSFLYRKTDVLSSGCGSSVILRLNTRNLLTTTGPVAQGSTDIATAQIKKISVYFNLESCP